MPESCGYHYYAAASIAVDAFPGTAQVSWTFGSVGLALLNTGVDPIEYSFDGTNVHGRLEASGPGQGIATDGRIAVRVWFRRAAGAAANTVRVTVWG